MHVFDYVKLVFETVVSVIFFGDPLYQIVKRLKRHGRYVKVPGVIIGRRSTRGELGMGSGTYSRAAIFRFTTLDGRVVEAESNVSSFPGPKPGRPVTVIYDPHDPDEAETTGRMRIIWIVRIIVMIGGATGLIHLSTHFL